MKNIDSILKDAGVELTDDQRTQISEAVKENYKTIADYQKQVDKVASLEETVNETKAQLQKFDGVDAEGLKQQIADLEKTIADKETEYTAKMADRDFNDLLEKSITGAKGKNAKAIKALLNLDDLKASKNQKEDLDKAIKALVEAEDSKMLFGEPEPQKLGTGDPIGTVAKGTGNNADIERARSIMGLPPISKQ